MKRMISLLLTLVLIFSLGACGKEKKPSSNTKPDTTQSKVEKKNETKDETSAGEITENQPTDTSTKDNIVAESSKQESTLNDVQSNTTVNTPASTAGQKFSPKVIASKCSHSFLPRTCTSLYPCTICGELLTKKEVGQVVEYGHIYSNNKCTVCGFERKGSIEFSGNFFALNQPITIDISLMTEDKEIEIYPCITLYKEVNGNWQPYSGIDVGEFFALEATHGEWVISNGIAYGRYDYMSNTILKTNPNALVETDFGPARLIRRFKLSISEPGTYKVDVLDGPNDSKKVSGQTHYYIINTY